jgi:subtilisin-like proprotein convertase family protein
MTRTTLIGMLAFLLTTAVNSKASLYAVGGIPVGNQVGVSFAGTYDEAAAGATVGSLTVDLTLGSGYNGGLYAYLVAPNGTMVVLMDQPGVTVGNPFGYAGSGMNITLSDAAPGSIQNTTETPGAVFSGTCQAAGTLASFNSSAADGTWTLYFADLFAGGGQTTLTGWSLDITAVPEPANVALALFGIGLIGASAVRCYRASRKVKVQPSARMA